MDFAFFVVKNWKAAKDAKSAEGMGKREELGDGAPRAGRRREADGAGRDRGVVASAQGGKEREERMADI